ncbi:MAG TPA: protein kinase [Thermoanaerobaculia bacterium]|jgi:serine/threonine-protein kinase
MPIASGTHLGPYEILAPLGAGGMGEVYRARDTRLGREIAIKVLPERLAASPDALSRFEKEARVVAALSHPNILALHDFGESAGIRYAVTELLEGETLRERLARQTLTTRKTVEIGAAMAEGLAAAHAKGVTHRDLKPENVFLVSDGRVKILDFGLARTEEPQAADAGTSVPTSAPSDAESGVAMGTVGYMAPEQVLGGTADARSDIFAFGCVLFEMVSGRRAFAARTAAETCAAILRDTPEMPRDSGAAAAPLHRIVARCLEKSPDERFQSARDLAFALKEVSGGAASEAAPKPASPGSSRRRWIWVALAAAGLVAAFLLWRQRQAPPASRIESIAVLPLANLSGDPQQEYFADGMTEELITALARISALRVTSRTSAMRYKGSTKSLPEIARELGVDAVVEGSVTRSGSRVKITAQLIDAAKDRHLWADSVERDVKDVLALQGEVARAIAGEIGIRLTSRERSRLASEKTVDPEAYESYLQGKYHMSKASTPDTLKALEYFRRAAEKQPDYALAYAGIASANERLSSSAYNVLPPNEGFPAAKAAAMRALELDPNLAEAYSSLGWNSFNFDRDWAAAEKHFRRALELDPNYSDGHRNYAIFLGRMGRFDESIREMQRAQQIDPVSLEANVGVGFAFHLAGREDEAMSWFRRALDLDPGFARGHWGLGFALLGKGKPEEAIAELQKAVELSGDGGVQFGTLGYAYAVGGNRTAARDVAERLIAKSKERYVPPAAVAIVYSGLGDRDQAMRWLEKANTERDPWITALQVEPMFDPLRADPRFQDLLRRVGFPPPLRESRPN